MKIEISTITKWLLTELDALDPVSVIVENYNPGQGKIIIECYGATWSSYWGSMSNMTVEKFFSVSPTDYLVEKLAPTLDSMVPDDGNALVDVALAQVDKLEDYGEIDDDIACSLKFEINQYLRYNIEGNEKLLCELFGSEWWHHLPEKQNRNYTYLCRIVDVVKEAFIKEDVK